MENKFGENKKSTLRDKVGGAVEKAGRKISEAGAHKLGRKVHDFGDKIETTHRNPSHPQEE